MRKVYKILPLTLEINERSIHLFDIRIMHNLYEVTLMGVLKYRPGVVG